MFYYMSKGDFYRIAAVVEVVSDYGHLLTDECLEKFEEWFSDCDHDSFDNFCSEVSDEWHDGYPMMSFNDYEGIANIINDCIKEWI